MEVGLTQNKLYCVCVNLNGGTTQSPELILAMFLQDGRYVQTLHFIMLQT